MKWKRTGELTLECGGWIIAKNFTKEGRAGAVYVLTENFKWVGNYETATEAQEATRQRGRAELRDVQQG